MGGGLRRALARGGRHRPALLALVLLLAAPACQLRADLNISVEADGSGEIEVALALDDEGVDENPGLLESLEFGDLRDAGWEVVGPERDDDGFTRVRVRHGFDSPSQVAELVDQVAGDDGPFQDFSVVRDDAFAETRYRFAGQVDFASGVRPFADDAQLAEALEADPLEVIERQLGGAVDQILRFQVAVRLPGDVRSNAPVQASNGAVWQPSVLEREVVELSATSTLRRADRVVWAGVAAVAGLALVLFVSIRVVVWRRSPSAPGADLDEHRGS